MKRLRITIEGRTYEVDVETIGESQSAAPAPAPAPVAAPAPAPRPQAAPAPAAAPAPEAAAPKSAGAGDVPSPLAAVVVSVDCEIGQEVSEGDQLVTLDAMKMNTLVTAPHGGKVTAIHVKQGDGVEEGQALVSLG